MHVHTISASVLDTNTGLRLASEFKNFPSSINKETSKQVSSNCKRSRICNTSDTVSYTLSGSHMLRLQNNNSWFVVYQRTRDFTLNTLYPLTHTHTHITRMYTCTHTHEHAQTHTQTIIYLSKIPV